MAKILKLAARNLARYWRRTLLTSGLIILGVVAVLLFVAVSGSFKGMIVGQITDSMLGHLQVGECDFILRTPADVDQFLGQLKHPAAVRAGRHRQSSTIHNRR